MQDADWREKTGWYLRRTDADGDVVFERRLEVDDAVPLLADDADAPDEAWIAAADGVATLTTDAALAQAEWELRGGRPGSAPQLPPTNGPRRYEIFLRGVEATPLGLAFPHLAVTQGDGFVVLAGALEPARLGPVIDRCLALGCQVVGVISDRRDARPAR
jgi:hypothetical protein